MHKNRYIKFSKISEAKFRSLVKAFALELTATQIAQMINLNRVTVNRYLFLFRKQIAQFVCEKRPDDERNVSLPSSDKLRKEIILLDGVRGRPFSQNTELIGVKSCSLGICSELIDGPIKTLLLAGLRGKIDISSLLEQEFSPKYQGIINVRQKKIYFFPKKTMTYPSDDKRQNGQKIIEHYWSVTRDRVARQHGIRRSMLYYHMMEWEFRYNYRTCDIYKLLLTMFRKRNCNLALRN